MLQLPLGLLADTVQLVAQCFNDIEDRVWNRVPPSIGQAEHPLRQDGCCSFYWVCLQLCASML